MTIQTPRLNDVFSYRPTERHCREGLAIVIADYDGSLKVQDTYWKMTRDNDSDGLSAIEWETAEFLGNLDDYQPVHGDNWRDYEPTDHLNVHSQRGLTPRHYIRTGAEKSIAVMISNAEYAVEEAEAKLRSARSGLDYRREDLARLIAERDNRMTKAEEVAA